MRRPGGTVFICDDGRLFERDTYTCGHQDQRVVMVKPGQDPADLGGLCKVCMKLICPSCVGKPCYTIERWVAEQEASYEARRSYGF